MSKVCQAYAAHILDAVARIREIETRGDIRQDAILHDATQRNLQTLSEATRHLPEDQRGIYPDIPWRDISGFRNILVHDYLGEIDPQTVLAVVNEHLPPLAAAVEDMLKRCPMP